MKIYFRPKMIKMSSYQLLAAAWIINCWKKVDLRNQIGHFWQSSFSLENARKIRNLSKKSRFSFKNMLFKSY